MHETNKRRPESSKKQKAKAVGVAVVAAAGLGLGVARAKEVYHPVKQPQRVQKYKHAGPDHNANFSAIIGGQTRSPQTSTKPEQHVGGGDGGEAIMVEPGNTEWVMAHKIAPNRDPRVVADEIDQVLPKDARHQNHMLQPGDLIEYDPSGHVVAFTESAPDNG